MYSFCNVLIFIPAWITKENNLLFKSNTHVYVKTKPGGKNSKDGRRITHMYNNKPSEYQWQRRLTANNFLRFEIYNLTWNETYEHKHIVFGKKCFLSQIIKTKLNVYW